MLTIRDDLPDGLLECPAQELYQVLDGPTLIRIRGRRRRPLFVSTLLHGNEASGLIAMQQVLRRYGGRSLPRSLLFFIGNVEAARHNKRYLAGQPDYNRIWCAGRGMEHDMTRRVLHIAERQQAIASIDIHNNTGRNPMYAIVANRAGDHLSLAGHFADKVVYATYPDTTCTVAFSRLCPAVTLECGLSADREGVRRVEEFVGACLGWHNHQFGARDVPVQLFHTVAMVTLSQACSYGFSGEDTDIQFVRELDRYNFRELRPGTRIATLRGDGDCLQVTRMNGDHDDGPPFFEVRDGAVYIARPVMPAMLTTDREAIGMDCLCYLMERLN